MKYFAFIGLFILSTVAFPVDDDLDSTEFPETSDIETTVSPLEPQGFSLPNSDETIEDEELSLAATATPLFFPEIEEDVKRNKEAYVETTPSPALEDKSDEVIINKQFFLHSAPQEFDAADFLPTSSPRPNIRVYFIALPPTVVKDINNLKPKTEESKVVFVVKKNKKSHEENATEESTNEDWRNEISREETDSKNE